MNLTRQAKTILDEANPSITWLRSQPKESVIQAVLEMKRIYSTDSMHQRQMAHDLAMAEIDIRKLELQSKLEATNNMIRYGVEIKENRYGPKAIGEVASIWNGEDTRHSVLAKSLPDSDLSERANLAEEQGIVWNLQNKRPGRESTIRKKVEEWEKGLDRGLNADLAVYAIKSAEAIKSSGPDYRAFMTGLCMQMEQGLGKDPQHRYLVPRFKNIVKQYNATVQPTPIAPLERAEKVIDQIYTEWLCPDYRAVIKKNDETSKVPGTDHLKRMIAKHIEMLGGMGEDETVKDRPFAVKILWDLTQPYTFPIIKDNLAWDVACQRAIEYLDYSNIHQTHSRSPKLMDDMYYEWWLGMCERVGLG
jgi:hypothetical protein